MKLEINVLPLENANNLKAVVSLTIEDNLVIKGFKLIEGKKGLFLSNPSSKIKDEYKDQVFFLKGKTRESVQAKAIEIYLSKLEKNDKGLTPADGDIPF